MADVTPPRPGDAVTVEKAKGGLKKDVAYEVVFTARAGVVVVSDAGVNFISHDDLAAAAEEKAEEKKADKK